VPASSVRRLAALAVVGGALAVLPAAEAAATEATGSVVGVPATGRSEIDPAAPNVGPAADPAALAAAAARLQNTDPGDLWGAADAVVSPITDGLWNAQTQTYVVSGATRARLNAEMLLVHAYAALAGRGGSAGHPERVEPLVRLLTGSMYVPTLNGVVPPAPAPGKSVTIHAPGFAEPGGGLGSMHPALDAVVSRALATAWRARDVVGLSAGARDLIVDRLRAVATSPYWRAPARLLNQINWSADVYAAYTTVTGDPTLMLQDYRRQLTWLSDHAEQDAYPGGSANFGSGFAFRYLPQRAASNLTNRSDTVEYANITLGALAYLDQGRAVGMVPLSTRENDVLRRFAQRVAYGDWTTAGYLNWDSGKGVGRLHLTQYWLLALRGYATGIQGSTTGGLLPDAVPTTRWLVRRAVQLYQRRSRAGGAVVLPASAYGISGSPLVSNTFDGLTGTARFASTLAELAERGLASPAAAPAPSRPTPDSYSHDRDIGRLAVSTSHYATAFLRPWKPLRVGGLEPSRLFDSQGRALTGVGGSGEGALGLRLSVGPRTLIETQPGAVRPGLLQAIVPEAQRDAAGPIGAGLDATASASGDGVRLAVAHRLAPAEIRTTYVVRNSRTKPIVAELRIPTYSTGLPTALGSLIVGQRYVAATLAQPLRIQAPTGGRFTVRLYGLPKTATGRVVPVAGQIGNPTPGPELRVRVRLPAKKTTTLVRVIRVPAAG
jgi:hypothetical protein